MGASQAKNVDSMGTPNMVEPSLCPPSSGKCSGPSPNVSFEMPSGKKKKVRKAQKENKVMTECADRTAPSLATRTRSLFRRNKKDVTKTRPQEGIKELANTGTQLSSSQNVGSDRQLAHPCIDIHSSSVQSTNQSPSSPRQPGSKSSILDKLRPSWLKRQRVEDIDDDALSGQQLDHVTSHSDGIPSLVLQCIEEIEKRDSCGLLAKGLYRLSGVKSKIDRLYECFEQGNEHLIDLASTDTHVLTGAVKQHFRMLPAPLIPYHLYREFIQLAIDWPQNEEQVSIDKVNDLCSLVERMPSGNKLTLAFLVRHLKRVADESKTNMMPVSNLGIVFGPSLLRKDEYAAALAESSHVARAVQLLIENCCHLFPDVSPSGSGHLPSDPVSAVLETDL